MPFIDIKNGKGARRIGGEENMIRSAKREDFETIREIYAIARKRMREGGNPTQWGVSYPPDELILEDIEGENLYVLEENDVHAVFFFRIGEDATYRVIEGGEWLSSSPYGVIHRVASDGRVKGVLPKIVRFCEEKIGHLRIDTHENNLVMRHQIEKCGFSRRGVIYTHGDSVDDRARIAYEKC